MIDTNPEHDDYRLSLGGALEIISDKLNEELSSYRYIYLFAFDSQDRIIFGQVLRPDDPSVALELLISEAKLLQESYTDHYFMVKIKEFNDYFEGFIDSQETLSRIKGFIKSWEGFHERSGGDNPALKRYSIEFINYKLDLPFRYSEKQRNTDMLELYKDIKNEIA